MTNICLGCIIFQSTPPVKAATFQRSFDVPAVVISIHAAREGGDKGKENPKHQGEKFQSTPPVKAATLSPALAGMCITFQSTPPVKAATVTSFAQYTQPRYFNPRRP